MTAIRMLVVMSLLTGALYTLGVTVAGNALFPHQAQGSLVKRNGVVVGSELLAQRAAGPGYFWPRPSAADFQTVPSGASNKGPTSEELRHLVLARSEALAEAHKARDAQPIPTELLHASASGLDPHISPGAAHFQIHRVAGHRQLKASEVARLVDSATDGSQFRLWGEPRVNVLKLNMAMDALENRRNAGPDGVVSTHATD